MHSHITIPRQPVSQGLGHEKDEKTRRGYKQPISIWPEWSDQDIASEKWVSEIFMIPVLEIF